MVKLFVPAHKHRGHFWRKKKFNTVINDCREGLWASTHSATVYAQWKVPIGWGPLNITECFFTWRLSSDIALRYMMKTETFQLLYSVNRVKLKSEHITQASSVTIFSLKWSWNTAAPEKKSSLSLSPEYLFWFLFHNQHRLKIIIFGGFLELDFFPQAFLEFKPKSPLMIYNDCSVGL